jgi:hypothetical protein
MLQVRRPIILISWNNIFDSMTSLNTIQKAVGKTGTNGKKSVVFFVTLLYQTFYYSLRLSYEFLGIQKVFAERWVTKQEHRKLL